MSDHPDFLQPEPARSRALGVANAEAEVLP